MSDIPARLFSFNEWIEEREEEARKEGYENATQDAISCLDIFRDRAKSKTVKAALDKLEKELRRP